MSAAHTINKLWRIADYIRDRPQGSFSPADDSRIFAHGMRYLRNAIEAVDNGRLSAATPTCEGCDDFPALPNSNFCAECQKDIKADSRHEDPARSHGRPQ